MNLLNNYLHLTIFCNKFTINSSYLYSIIQRITQTLQHKEKTEEIFSKEEILGELLKILFLETRNDQPEVIKIKEWFQRYIDLEIDSYTSILLVNYVRIYRPLLSNEQFISEDDLFRYLIGLRLLILPPTNFMNQDQWCEKVDQQMMLFKDNQPTPRRLSWSSFLRGTIQIFPVPIISNNSSVRSNYLDQSEQWDAVEELSRRSHRSILNSQSNTPTSHPQTFHLRSFPEIVYPFSAEDLPLTPIHLVASSDSNSQLNEENNDLTMTTMTERQQTRVMRGRSEEDDEEMCERGEG